MSVYQSSKGYGPDLGDQSVENVRRALGGNLAQMPTTQVRWYLSDLEAAQHAADAGDISQAAKLWRAMRRDGVVKGLMGTLTGGIASLPKRVYGRYGVDDLNRRNGTMSVLDLMVPPSEWKLMLADGHALGVSIGELVPVEGRDFPILVRLEPEYLRYRWYENRWYYQSLAGPLPIDPGDGRWVLHTPGGRIAPWINGLWPALGRSFINKEHALLHRANYSAKLANPARYAKAPPGADEPTRTGFLANLIAWGVNTVFELPPGWDVGLLETKGEGWQVFQSEIDTSDKETAITIAGQVVTVDGGVGFQNSDVFRAIRADIIKEVAEEGAYTLNTQVIPHFVAGRYGIGAINEGACVEYDITRPKDMLLEAQGYTALAAALGALREQLEKDGRSLDVDELVKRYGVPVLGDQDGDGVPDVDEETGVEIGGAPQNENASARRYRLREVA